MPMNEDQLVLIRDERREQIMQAAQKVFATKGIAGTKMSMIAAEAGISHGLLYHYFKSKEELFTAVVQQAIDDSIGAIGQLQTMPGSPLDKMRMLTELILTENNSLPFMVIQQARTSEAVPEAARRLVAEQYSMQAYVERLLPLFEEGQRTGELAAGDPKELIACYLSVMTGLMLIHSRENEDFRVTNAELLLRILKG